MSDHKPEEPKPSDFREDPKRSPEGGDTVPTEAPGESEAHPS